ncbi:Trp biosynthesis-associated membrane protein [Leucobacter allii]|uniref:Trp biosynthesis-associated membrane protein n=1 Tax=Leucobacter allii TaxID=2932247 RepID=UPI001FD3824D|nr:Trp biosynthesis-associated membrane protein [Leucobacter allii]UOR02966.1 Trp biosynthesis-associated membrane protein [Leucobacter allii]
MRAKLPTLAAVALSGGLGLVAGSQRWVSFMLETEHRVETVAGNDVNSALAPVSIAVVAAALALTIAGPVFRRVLGVLVALLGAGLIALTLGVVVDPLSAIRGRITALTGIAGSDTSGMVVWHELSPWVWASVVAGAVAVLAGTAVVVAGGRWAAAGRKYDAKPRAAASGAPDRISDWDALSGGDDPSEAGGDADPGRDIR